MGAGALGDTSANARADAAGERAEEIVPMSGGASVDLALSLSMSRTRWNAASTS